MTEDEMNVVVARLEAGVKGLLSGALKELLPAACERRDPPCSLWLNLSVQITTLEKKVSALEEENHKLRQQHVEIAQYLAESADLLAVLGTDEVPADAARRLIAERDKALDDAKFYKKDRDDKGQLVKELLSQRDEAERKSAEVLHRFEALEKSARSRIGDLERVVKPLVDIADRYDDNGLDECRPEWHERLPRDRDSDKNVLLYSGRGGKELLYLRDALEARSVMRGDK